MAIADTACRLLAPAPPRPDAPLWVYLPGMDGTGELFYKQAPALATQFDVRCLAIPRDDTRDWGALAWQTQQLIQAERRSRPVYLCGESFGGCLALLLAAQTPEWLSGLVLVNPASAFQRVPGTGILAAVAPWTAPLFHNVSTTLLAPLLLAVERVPRRDRQNLLQAAQSVAPQTAAWRLSLLQNFQIDWQRLKQVTAPTVVVASGRDRILPALTEAQRLSQALPQAQTWILPHSGHACLLETEVNLHNILSQVGLLPTTASPLPERA